jgi:hypothetical protein
MSCCPFHGNLEEDMHPTRLRIVGDVTVMERFRLTPSPGDAHEAWPHGCGGRRQEHNVLIVRGITIAISSDEKRWYAGCQA